MDKISKKAVLNIITAEIRAALKEQSDVLKQPHGDDRLKRFDILQGKFEALYTARNLIEGVE